MKNLNDFILERLKLDRSTKIAKISSSYNAEDFPVKTRKNSGEKFQWFQWWEYVLDNGPISKSDLLIKFGKEPTSYGTVFADLSKKNIIVPQKRKLVAMPPEKWIVK